MSTTDTISDTNIIHFIVDLGLDVKGIANTLCVLAEYAQIGSCELSGDELHFIGMHMLRMSKEIDSVVERIAYH